MGAWLLRQGMVLEYRTGHRGHRERSEKLAPWQHRLVSAERVAATLLAVVALPVAAFAVALDGRSWTSLVTCQVQLGTNQESNTLIELTRMGNADRRLGPGPRPGRQRRGLCEGRQPGDP